jgi:hypothetical protein
MLDFLLGALKAAAPSLLSLAYVAVDVLLGAPVNTDTLQPILYGLVTSIAVYLVPNIRTGGTQESAANVKV